MTFLLDSLKAILLGLIQGLTGWLPVSSRAHILLFQSIWPLKPEILFEFLRMTMPIGAYLAVFLCFRQQIFDRKGWVDRWRHYILATIPIVTLGLVFSEWLEKMLSAKFIVATLMMATGAILFLIIQHRYETIDTMDDQRALLSGSIQAIALIPGISWMAAGLFSGIYLRRSKKECLQFSFVVVALSNLLLSITKIATFYKEGYALGTWSNVYIILAIAAAYFSSQFILKRFLRFYTNKDLKKFGIYQIVLGLLMIFFFYVL